MLKIKDDVDLEELKKYHFAEHDKENAVICYYRLMPMVHRAINILIEINKDRTIGFQLPLGCSLDENKIILKDYIQDLIQAGLIEEIPE